MARVPRLIQTFSRVEEGKGGREGRGALRGRENEGRAEEAGREAGGGESDDDPGDKVPQFYIYKLPIVRFSGCILLV